MTSIKSVPRTANADAQRGRSPSPIGPVPKQTSRSLQPPGFKQTEVSARQTKAVRKKRGTRPQASTGCVRRTAQAARSLRWSSLGQTGRPIGTRTSGLGKPG
eukprot:533683-Rhodomonas_salina.2